MKQVCLTMVPLRNLSQQVNQYKNNKRRNVTLLFRLHGQKQVNHQLRHNHNIVQKVTHQNNPHLKAQKTNHLQSKHQLNNLQQKKNLHRNKVRSLLLKVILIVVVNLITNLIKINRTLSFKHLEFCLHLISFLRELLQLLLKFLLIHH